LKKILLDARELAHPEPFTICVNHLKTMDSEAYLYMINNINPTPLLEIAQKQGYHFHTHEDENNIWHIIISKNTCDLKTLVEDV